MIGALFFIFRKIFRSRAECAEKNIVYRNGKVEIALNFFVMQTVMPLQIEPRPPDGAEHMAQDRSGRHRGSYPVQDARSMGKPMDRFE